MTDLDAQARLISGARFQPMRLTGRVVALRGMTVLVRDLPLPVGSLVMLRRDDAGARPSPEHLAATLSNAADLGEVIGFDGERSVVMMLAGTVQAGGGIRPGDRVVGLQAAQTISVSDAMLGRVVNGLGRPIDGKGPIGGGAGSARLLEPEPIGPLQRRRIAEPMHTGVRAVDLFTTLGRGQRMGVFAGPGVGKSTLLGAIARSASADVSVVGLIGERGREVRDFIEHNLGEVGLKRSVVVAATGDESPLLRVRAAQAACAVAEYFRDRGKSVMLIMDSVTRFAHALRQVGLSTGEPPATRGYTPSVFAGLARLLERAGALERTGPTSAAGGAATAGSITGLYSVLVEGDDMNEPIADAVRGILDGHLILSRTLAQRAHYPAIDVLDSVSRVADDVTDHAHQAARRQIVRLLALYKSVEDLLQIGAYARGANPEADVAIDYHRAITEMLQQNLSEPLGEGGAPACFDQWRSQILKLAIQAGADLQRASTVKARPAQSVPTTGRRA
ncbi:MAG: FliI/YscN family ATPase [Phycisphaerales bacterium]